MKILILAAIALVITGCNTTVVERKSDGSIKGANSRWFWSSESYEWQYTSNGVFSAKATKSNPDAESIKAVAEGVAKGAVQGLK